MVGMETLLPLSLLLVHDHGMSLPHLLSKLTSAPAALLGLTNYGLHEGARADMIAFDPDAPWRVSPSSLRSTAKNTPFEGLPISGRVVARWIKGKQVEA
jgi:dihydroorotase